MHEVKSLIETMLVVALELEEGVTSRHLYV